MSSEIVQEPPPKEGDVVIAVDFGSSRTAYSWTKYGDQSGEVKVVKEDGDMDGKVPTSVLLRIDDQDRITVESFGTEAETSYAEDAERDCYLFRRFKMKLHHEFRHEPQLSSECGRKRVPLTVVLEKCLEWIKDDALDKVKKHGGALSKPQDAVWVLTVPAIWSPFARNAMRRAAYKAGMIDRVQSMRLVVALEPESACLAFMADANQKGILKVNDQFMIVDCGHGTLDITTHRLTSATPIKLAEVALPTGGDLGGMKVDKKFSEFFEALLGRTRYENLKTNHAATHLELMKEWEGQKRTFKFDGRKKPVKFLLGSVTSELGIRNDIERLVSEWNDANQPYQVETNGVEMSLPFKLMYSFFEQPVQKVVDKVEEVVNERKNEHGELQHFILVGGFANCKLLEMKMRERFPTTVVGNQPDHLVVKGASMFGAQPLSSFFINRKAKYTYGVRTTEEYNEADVRHRPHTESQYTAPDGKQRLNIFDIHGFMGDTIDLDKEPRRLSYSPIADDQTTIDVEVLATKANDVFVSEGPILADDPNVQVLGKISALVDMQKPKEKREIGVEFYFGCTEVQCNVYDNEGNPLGRCPIDYERFWKGEETRS